jgi:hypothetical protein
VAHLKRVYDEYVFILIKSVFSCYNNITLELIHTF